MALSSDLPLGANLTEDGSCSFLVWAPRAKAVTLEIETAPRPCRTEMAPLDNGYFHCVARLETDTQRYFYVLDGEKKRPDPASKYQPEGVHGPSQIPCNRFSWTDSAWSGLHLNDAVFYELHVGTFTPEGTFDAIIDRLSELKSLGITLIELMPVAQFPGDRNWGYDGVYPYAVQNSYGSPCALKRLVDACHELGIGVTLDVVYNHLGPEGNYLSDFGPYFTDRYSTPWGNAINFDGPDSDEVRRFFLDNALYWITEFHIDALRLDAIHAIVDLSARRFLEELTERVSELSLRLGRKMHIIAENDRNDARALGSRDVGGFGLDSQWNDDFHHSIHALVTGERDGYYQDFGSLDHLAKACRGSFVYSGQYSAFRRRHHGSSSADTPCYQFVVFSQNHDQVGNRAKGDRLTTLVCFETLKLVAGVVLLSSFLPLLFMGEEYGETAPFQYFVSHGDADLIEEVREGRRREFEHFAWGAALPDPASPDTFARCKLNWEQRNHEPHRTLFALYAELLRLRKTVPALANPSKANCKVASVDPDILIIERWHETDRLVLFYNFGENPICVHHCFAPGLWEQQLDSSDEKWGGSRRSAPSFLQGADPTTLEMPRRSFTLYRLSPRGAD